MSAAKNYAAFERTFVTLFGPPTPTTIGGLRSTLAFTKAELDAMGGRKITCNRFNIGDDEDTIASRSPDGRFNFQPPFFNRKCEHRENDCAQIEQGAQVELFRRRVVIHEASHVKLRDILYAFTGMLPVMPFIDDKNYDPAKNPDSVAIFAVETGSGSAMSVNGAEEYRDINEEESSQSGPLLAALRTARWFAVSGLENMREDAQRMRSGERARIVDANCEALLKIFEQSFVIGSAPRGRLGSLSLTYSNEIGSTLAEKMDTAALGTAAFLMIQLVLLEHGLDAARAIYAAQFRGKGASKATDEQKVQAIAGRIMGRKTTQLQPSLPGGTNEPSP